MSRIISTKSSTPRRFSFDRHFDDLKGEFEQMAQEIESLLKERDEFKAKVDTQAKELEEIRRIVCGRSHKGVASVPRTITSFQRKASKSAIPVSSKLLSQPSYLKKPRTSPGRVNSSQLQTFKTALSAEPHQLHTVTQTSEPVVAHSRPVSLTSASSQLSEERNQSIVLSNNVENELDVQMVHVLSHGNKIRCVKFSRDGKYLAAACWDGKAYIYNVDTGTEACVLKNLLAEDDSKVHTVCFSGDGRYLATGSSDGNVYIWEIKTKYVRNAFKGHANEILRLEFSPSGRLLVSTSYDNSVRIWNMRDGAAKVLIEDNPMVLDEPCYTSASFSPDGRFIAASHRDGMVRMWDARTGYMTRRVQTHRQCAYKVVFMPNGKYLISGSGDTTLRYWDTIQFCARSQKTNNLPGVSEIGIEEDTAQPELEFSGHTQLVSSVAVSPDGRWVASASFDKTLRIWDTINGAMQCMLHHGDQLTTVDFSPAGSYLVAGDKSGTVKIWRYSTLGGSQEGIKP